MYSKAHIHLKLVLIVEIGQCPLHLHTSQHNLHGICSIVVGHTSSTHIGIANSLYLLDIIFCNDIVESDKQFVEIFYQLFGICNRCNLGKPLNIRKQHCNHIVFLRFGVTIFLNLVHCILRKQFLYKLFGLLLLHNKFVGTHFHNPLELELFLGMNNVPPRDNKHDYNNKTQEIKDIGNY